MKKEESQNFEVLRIWAEALYDHQSVRISSLNRVRTLIRRKLLDMGFEPDKKKKEGEYEEGLWNDKEINELMKLAQEQNKLTEADHNFLMDSLKLANRETEIELEYHKHLMPLVKQEPIWNEWLEFVNGIDVRNACRLLRYYGYCERFDTVSKLWAYSGLAVVDGRAVMRKKGEKLNYNLKIKTGMIGVLGKNLILASKSYKKNVYDTYKARIQERGCCERKHAKLKGKMCKDMPGHANRMAIRKMVKVFLEHYWRKTRELKGLPTRQPYPIGKDGHTTDIKPFYDKQPSEI